MPGHAASHWPTPQGQTPRKHAGAGRSALPLAAPAAMRQARARAARRTCDRGAPLPATRAAPGRWAASGAQPASPLTSWRPRPPAGRPCRPAWRWPLPPQRHGQHAGAQQPWGHLRAVGASSSGHAARSGARSGDSGIRSARSKGRSRGRGWSVRREGGRGKQTYAPAARAASTSRSGRVAWRGDRGHCAALAAAPL